MAQYELRPDIVYSAAANMAGHLCDDLDGLAVDIRLQDARHAAFFRIAPVMMAVLTAEGALVEVNAQWSRRLGWSDAWLLEHGLYRLVHGDDQEKLDGFLYHIRRMDYGEPWRARLMKMDGDLRWVDFTASQIDEAGHSCLVGYDVTHRVAAQQISWGK